MDQTHSSKLFSYRFEELCARTNHVQITSDDAADLLKLVRGPGQNLPIAMVSLADDTKLDFGYGTAFFIAPGIAITALHVIEEMLEKKKSAVFLNYWMPEAEAHRRWFVNHVAHLNGSDLAIVSCEYLDKEKETEKIFNVVTCNCYPAALEDDLLVLGTVPNNDTRSVSTKFSKGKVKDIITKKVGQNSLISQTEYIVEAASAGGMSGGPAFDAKGRCVGVVSSGMDFHDGSGYTRIIGIGACFHGLIPSRFLPVPDELELAVTAIPYLCVQNFP